MRKQLASALSGAESHITFDKALSDFPHSMRGAKPHGAPHSAWELIEHMRIAQRDILDFIRDPQHESPAFPDGYWPPTPTPPSNEAWDACVRAFQEDRRELERLIEKADLFAPFPHGSGQTLLREAIVAANHNSYQLGQVVFLKRMLEH